MEPPDCAVLNTLQDAEAVGALDARFAGFMAKLDGRGAPEELCLASALTSRATRSGHVCLDLAKAEALFFPEGRPEGCPPFPSAGAWVDRLSRSAVVGRPGAFTPLVLDDQGRLYLHRYWAYQETLARRIRELAARVDTPADLEPLRRSLERHFPAGDSHNGVNWQKVAACAAMLRGLTVISGGPGTGKTTTVARILALIHEARRECASPPRIGLAAPTGKAAARLGEAVRRIASEWFGPGGAPPGFPRDASTLHRLLGTVRGSPDFRHGADHPLPLDILVVDEASMVDLALMSKLVEALPPHARLVLVGDRDQLASVESGAVLGDICGRNREPFYSPAYSELLKEASGEPLSTESGTDDGGNIRDSIVLLRKSRRFQEASGLGRFSRLVNEGDAVGAVSLLRDERPEDVQWLPLPGRSDLPRALGGHIRGSMAQTLKDSAPLKALERFGRFRILCALREGPYGAVSVNGIVERSLEEEGRIRPDSPWYAGRPILVMRNDYEVQLFNGDVGILLPPGDGEEVRACFPGTDGALRAIHPMRLPEHETAFAMTVHKSQGSEFDRILLILSDRASPVLTRELLYTAVTRARHFVEIWAPEEVLRTAVSRGTLRSSGLGDALWGRAGSASGRRSGGFPLP